MAIAFNGGRVLINAEIAAGYALTLRLRHHWYLVLVLLVD